MSREIITITVQSADYPEATAQTQLAYEQFVEHTALALDTIYNLTARVRADVANVSPVAVAFTVAGKKLVRRAR